MLCYAAAASTRMQTARIIVGLSSGMVETFNHTISTPKQTGKYSSAKYTEAHMRIGWFLIHTRTQSPAHTQRTHYI